MPSADAVLAVHDMSLWSLFWQAHIVVKLVMLGLLLASFWCWAIIINKTLLFSRTAQAFDRFEDIFWSGKSLEELYSVLEHRTPVGLASVFVTAMREWKRSFAGDGRTLQGLARRIDKVIDVAIQREVERLEGGLLVLASIGSAGPYIGLFGTVWGIMVAFTSIAASRDTSLAVVAPGIAEALFATAMGLFAAIPAVLAFNRLQAQVGKFQTRLETFGDEFSAILSRQIDERMARPA
ncbi:MAG: protein TolQ [Methylobacteriaceae bacterium]|jgi:biopolymer transport protein TolQ|nr:protein TolQ [Methylobacteriaceae bacterium]